MSSGARRDFSVLADELVAAWEAGDTIPDLTVLLRGSSGLSAEQVTELCLTDQSFRWRTAEPLPVEDYLAACPAAAADPELVLELAYGEIRVRQQLGQPPPAGEIEARFPDLASRLQKQLEVGFWMDEGVASPGPAIAVPPICEMHQSGRFGPYELGEAIAHGGMGVVFRSRDLRLNRVVALKVIRPDRITHEADLRRFHNEMVTIAQLDHPHIVPIYDVGEVNGVHYFTMKLMEGGDLQQQRGRYLNAPRAAAQVVADVAGAVHYAHRCGVLHRDVKPSNVLLDEAGRPHITDFGLARRLDDETPSTEAGKILGTPAYLAPERLSPKHGPLTVAADVYGLGALLYVLLTGNPPFDDKHLLEMLESIRQREPEPPRRLNPRVDRDLEQICLKALAKRPADRYGSAQEFADDLQRFLAGQEVQARPMPWWQRRWRWVRRHPDLATITGIMLVAAAVLLTLLGLQTMRLEKMRHSLDSSLQSARGQRAEAQANREESARLRRTAEDLQSRAEEAYAEAVRKGRLARKTAYAAAIHHVELALRAGDTTEFSRLMDEQLPPADQPDVRGFEWFLLDRLHRPRPEHLPVLLGPVRCVSYSPDGRLLAAAGDPGLVQVLDTTTERVAASWLSLTTTRDLTFSPDGTLLAAVGDDGHVRVFPAGGGAPQAWPIATLPVWQVAFVGNEPLLATRDQDGQIRLIDRRDGTVAATYSSEPARIQGMAVAPDGQWLIAGDRDGNLKVWDLASRQSVYEFEPTTKCEIMCLAVSSDGIHVAVGDLDYQVRVARLHRPWAHEWILAGQHFDRLQNLAFSADGRRVACCDKNGSVRVWRLDRAAVDDAVAPEPPEHAWQAHQGRAYDVAFDPRQDRVVTGGQENHVAVWELRGAEDILSLGEVGRETAADRSLAFSPDSTRLAAAAEDGVQLWNLRTRQVEARLSQRRDPRDHVAISGDGRYLAAARNPQRTVEVWRKAPEGYLLLWETKEQACYHLAFSPQADALVVFDWNGDEAAVYDPANGRLERKIPAQQCWGGEFSPDGHQLAFTELDDVVVWDWPARRPLRRLRGHLSTVNGVAYSPDGRLLASYSRDRRIILWDAATGRQLRTLMGHRVYPVQAVFVGNDRLVSLADDGTIRVWDAELGLQLCCLREDRITQCFRLAVSPDQRWLACRLANGDVQLFEVAEDKRGSVPVIEQRRTNVEE